MGIRQGVSGGSAPLPTGSWKDRARRILDACIASALPGGRRVSRILFRIDGYLYPHEAVFLYWLGRTMSREGAAVEIGSFRGRSTLCLATGVRDGGHGCVFAIDPHLYGTCDELRRNIRHFGLDAHVTVVPERSVDAASPWTRPVEVVFIDGDHAYEEALADVRSWLPHLAPGGLLVLHDSTDLSGFEGSRRVAKTVCRIDGVFDAVGTLGAMTWARRQGGSAPRYPRRYGERSIDGIIGILKSVRSRSVYRI